MSQHDPTATRLVKTKVTMNQGVSSDSLRLAKKDAPGSRAARMSVLGSTSKHIAEPRLFTRAVPPPALWTTLQETRLRLRMLQFLAATVAFASLAASVYGPPFTSSPIGGSGMTFMVAVSLSSMIISASCILLYLFPSFLNIPPHRHPRFSRVEVTTDFVYVCLWTAASLSMAVSGRCPPTSSVGYLVSSICFPWNFSMAFGFVGALLVGMTYGMGVFDMRKYGHRNTHGRPTFSRQTWTLPNTDDD
ncbi:hypothetical protein SeMB42_g01404 [Synchytrium endobioticum]|uniref:MARVEL domain-containing protein n=1 Tax=Synchytrium endobioticum TaxID=286115 RepID=A0A507DFF7_9FUNG|nr:hypothetical protein SeLEV6574_g01017 [Synchytrium endobioticum]TPX52480.1 hypothetical protein SeMB42_g01404 [Synchytrium endobioticum]